MTTKEPDDLDWELVNGVRNDLWRAMTRLDESEKAENLLFVCIAMANAAELIERLAEKAIP